MESAVVAFREAAGAEWTAAQVTDRLTVPATQSIGGARPPDIPKHDP